MSGQILVTGATGNVGSEVVKGLLAKGIPLKAGVRNAQRRTESKSEIVEYVSFDFTKPETFPKAFSGVNRLFLVRPPAISRIEEIRPAISYAKEQGVKQIVFLSLLGAEQNPFVPHHKIEKAIVASGIPYTFLRPGFFMQNLTGLYLDEIKNQDLLYVPAGKGRTSFIDARDIAAVAVVALTEPGHLNKAYTLTGGEALDYYEVAEIFTRILGRKITYANPSGKEFQRHLLKKGESKEFAKVMRNIHLTVKLGLAKKVTPTVEQLLGRPPITLEQFVRDYQELFCSD